MDIAYNNESIHSHNKDLFYGQILIYFVVFV